MSARKHKHTVARRAALQVLYTGDVTGDSPTEIAEEGRVLDDEVELSDYALKLIRGVEAHMATIDKHLASTSENWTLSRMPLVDRSILRLATCEILFIDEVPTSVAINEAVELAKEFGGKDESSGFVNGVLGRIAKFHDQGEPLPLSGEEKSSADEPAANDPVVEEADEKDVASHE